MSGLPTLDCLSNSPFAACAIGITSLLGWWWWFQPTGPSCRWLRNSVRRTVGISMMWASHTQSPIRTRPEMPCFGESKLLTKPDSYFCPAHVLSICPSKYFETWIFTSPVWKIRCFPIENDEHSLPNSHKFPTSHHTTRQVFGFSLGTGWIASRECVRKAYNEICGFDKARFPGTGRDG